MTPRAAAPWIAAALTVASGCTKRAPVDPPGSCGADVRVVSAQGHRVTLEIINASGDPIAIGASTRASFIDATGHVMTAQMTPSTDDWFMPFQLPPHSRRTVTVLLGAGGDPATLDRVTIPDSGNGFVPTCTVDVSGLAGRS